jgi:WD40 repeat protein
MFSPDGQSLVSSSSDGTIKLWSVRPNTQTSTLPSLDYRGNRAILWCSGDGKRVIVADVSNHLYQCEISAGVAPRRLNSPIIPERASTAISPNGKTLALGNTNGVIELWNLESGTHTATYLADKETDGKAIYQIEFAPDGRSLISAHEGGRIKIKGLTAGEPEVMSGSAICVPSSFKGSFAFVLSSDGRRLAAYRPNRDGIDIWDLGDGRLLGTLHVRTDNYEPMAFSRDGKWLANSTQGNSVLLWDVVSKQCTPMPVKEAMEISSVAFAPDGQTLVVTTADNVVSFWKIFTSPDGLITSEEILRELDYYCPSIGPRLFFSPTGEYLFLHGKVFPGWKTTLVVWHAPLLADIAAKEQAKVAGGFIPEH